MIRFELDLFVLKFRIFAAENASDISPYATFQLGDGTNTLLHNIMYQDHELMEGAPTPQTTVNMHFTFKQNIQFC